MSESKTLVIEYGMIAETWRWDFLHSLNAAVLDGWAPAGPLIICDGENASVGFAMMITKSVPLDELRERLENYVSVEDQYKLPEDSEESE